MRKVIPLAVAAMVAVPVAHAATTKTLHASMNGKNEAPTAGDPDGKGQATIRIKGRRVCWSVSYSKIQRPTMGHIHKAPKGEPGPVVVGLFATAGKRSGCVNTTSALAKDIVKNPRNYYVNLHNATYPNGAIRGQLRR